MNAGVLLAHCQAMGAILTPQADGKLHVEAPAPLPADLVEVLRENKPEILRRLEARDRLVARLRAGILWLTESNNALSAYEDAGDTFTAEYERLRVRFLAGLDTWNGLDYMLRYIYRAQGCVMAMGRCPDDAPVCCRACGGLGDDPGPLEVTTQGGVAEGVLAL